MLADAEIKRRGFRVLSQQLGMLDAERFLSLVQRERFDYTQWRQDLFEGLSGEEISRRAMEYRRSKKLVETQCPDQINGEG